MQGVSRHFACFCSQCYHSPWSRWRRDSHHGRSRATSGAPVSKEWLETASMSSRSRLFLLFLLRVGGVRIFFQSSSLFPRRWAQITHHWWKNTITLQQTIQDTEWKQWVCLCRILFDSWKNGRYCRALTVHAGSVSNRESQVTSHVLRGCSYAWRSLTMTAKPTIDSNKPRTKADNNVAIWAQHELLKTPVNKTNKFRPLTPMGK